MPCFMLLSENDLALLEGFRNENYLYAIIKKGRWSHSRYSENLKRLCRLGMLEFVREEHPKYGCVKRKIFRTTEKGLLALKMLKV